ncbi:ankyrin repeat domain-containing protein 24 [Erpetoichthys calabaricus]|uniref:ankyrin repeat domain-containing protein 24 n=1 Tax=Erpetoichthys calabaricus TaxID=27687 RepID=UPI0022340E6D|nr:ankyrin repeat domain-containing protein 24 [Erpetoichthys calabaricus]
MFFSFPVYLKWSSPSQVTLGHDWSKNDEKLLQAAEANNVDRLSNLLIKKGLNPLKLDPEGKSAFHVCAMRGSIDCLEILLSHGVDVTVLDGAGLSTLHLAAKYGHPECVKRLLQESSPVDLTDTYGRTALHHAAICGSLSCIYTLCDFKAAVNTKDGNGATSLILAAHMSRSELCGFLIEQGAKVDAQDLQGRTALMLACENDSLETVDLLLRAGADAKITDHLGHSAVHYSMATGNEAVLHLLKSQPIQSPQSSGKPGMSDTKIYLWQAKEFCQLLLLNKVELLLNKINFFSFFCALPVKAEKDFKIPKASPHVGSEKGTPRKRKAPPPPQVVITPSPDPPAPAKEDLPVQTNKGEDEEVFEEIRRLRQERARLLQKIKSLEQLCQSAQQQESRMTSLEEELGALQEMLKLKEQENEVLSAQVSELHGRVQNAGDEDTESQDSQDVDDLLEFPGAEKLLSRMSRTSDDDILSSLQKEVDLLNQENKDLQEKVKMLEMYEKDDTNMEMSSGEDFIPVTLYDSLKQEMDQLQDLYKQAQCEVTALQELGTTENAGDVATLKQEYEARIQQLEAALAEAQKSETPNVGDESLVTKYEETLAELERLQEQVKMSENNSHSPNSEVLEEGKSQISGLSEKLVEKEQMMEELEKKVKELQMEMTHMVSLEEYEEMKLSLNYNLEEISRERAALAESRNTALLEIEKMKSQKSTKDEEEDEEEGQEKEDVSETLAVASSVQEVAVLEAELKEMKNLLEETQKNVQAEKESLTKEIRDLQDQLQSQYIHKAEYEKLQSKLSTQLQESSRTLQELRDELGRAQQDNNKLLRDVDSLKRESVPKAEHLQIKESLEKKVQQFTQEQASLDTELTKLREQKEGSVSKEEHEQTRCSLQVEVNTLTARLSELTRKHEKTCTEVFQVQREALFMKSEKHAAEAQLATVEKQLSDLKAESGRVHELHKNIEESNSLVKERDRKITELSKEVFKLKEALGTLSNPLTPICKQIPARADHHELETLKSRVSVLQGQIQECEKKHLSVVSVYRAHLLSAVQGRMDEEVRVLLLQILRMHQLGGFAH